MGACCSTEEDKENINIGDKSGHNSKPGNKKGGEKGGKRPSLHTIRCTYIYFAFINQFIRNISI